MPEYTDLDCGSREVAAAVKAYLESELASIEAEERPKITAIIEKATLRLTYHADDCHRADWDMQALGYRDGYVQATEDAVTAALDRIDAGKDDDSTKATTTAWNMACTKIAAAINRKLNFTPGTQVP